MQLKTKHSKGSFGFTLIELLVVIAIISMLLAMLMPSLNSAKRKAQQAVCLTNLHSLVLSWESYSQDNGQRLCPPFTGGRDGGQVMSWVNDSEEGSSGYKGGTEFAIKDGLLWPYIEDMGSYNCPSDASGRLRSYAMSFTMGGGYGMSVNGPISSRNGLTPVTKSPKTSGKLVFIDAEPGCSICVNNWVQGSFIPIKADVREWIRMTQRSDMSARHDDGCNVAFADGSCGSWKWESQETLDFIEDKTILSQGAIGNPDYLKVLKAMDQAN